MSEIRVPELGESIVEATVLNWFKQPGDPVSAGEAVAELETDKVNVEVIAEEDGVLTAITAGPGETVQVGHAIGEIGPAGAGSEGAARGAEAPAAAAPAPAPAAPVPTPAAAPQAQPAAQAAPAATAAAPAPAADNGLSRATPAVRRLAHERGVDLNQVVGTGGMGRITEQDVLAYANRSSTPAPAAQASAAPAPAARPAAAPQAEGARPDEEVQKMSRRRQTIARRLVEVQHTAAMLTTFNEIDMTNVMEVRKRRKAAFSEKHGVNLGFMSFFTKATVAALKQFPLLNAEIRGDEMIVKHHYDIGIAVAAEGGLVVPVVRDADRLNFAEIEREIARLAEKARSNTLSLSDLQGGTFTITNGGVFGSLFSTPILNGPQVGILGMHGIQQRPIAVNGQVEIRPMMYVALSYDHRIVDGAEAVQFLVTIKRLIEDPESLLLEG
ncbi:2-oxoglutarate dehydrogenase complex dihydrolipoyllysine-residue succinyltransferase [Alicyclobacillus cycloheptanicus]|uniref:Dihydrolipoyllysine-residue succinyltransferase component of 2-oxoglutarate dehydrogenase complex n=1 Tax=Alicyclobacillus cycloheptanicus TaxID=1457 RepID=A0ABT9XNB1_9BACL|nr:2-oxoglutarate dehydrogenase complex dihydrolipoyllysine-residue succinyltransferase [Alicyclobacillus cycloheptanicus]MDQ0191223.1 2-oxoglutarate dehydrogenase E2 component (dihydrolipoamide succinyltransferase) [Alicyclobacillus cycloheptanicus]WDM01538.1 2-oxoglutarate dehydrogenase complex dihydrolipoyllysine-residue succinyltransferase [Alicyclobacillus cycloheptanicus]